jgi:tetrahydromethanopterin S-methyltransferase subunit A
MELRDFVAGSVAPKAEKLAALEEVVRTLREEANRSSQADLEAEAKLSAHELRIQRIEAGVQSAASSSAQVEKFLSGILPPKVVGAILGVMGLVQLVIQAVQLLRGH